MYLYNILLDNARSFVPEQLTHYGRTEEIRKKFPSWQYNGIAEFHEMIEWCTKYIHIDFVWDSETIYFRDEKIKMLFLLRWS